MEPESNEYSNNTFQVFGQEVCIMSPMMARIVIQCSFPYTADPTVEQRNFVMNQTNKVVNYLLAEDMLGKSKDVGIIVQTNHKKA